MIISKITDILLFKWSWLSEYVDKQIAADIFGVFFLLWFCFIFGHICA